MNGTLKDIGPLKTKQPSPTAGDKDDDIIIVTDDPDENKGLRIAELLREIEPHCEWIRVSGERVYAMLYGYEHYMGGFIKRIEKQLLLGAICADCRHRGWGYTLMLTYPVGDGFVHRFKISHSTSGDPSTGVSEESDAHAALLAFHDALLVCLDCNGEGWTKAAGMVDGKIFGKVDCESCNGTGKVREVNQ